MTTAARITLADEGRLTWFFCHGEAEFQRSVHGAMADRLARDSMGANRCPVCKGAGVILDERARQEHTRRRKGEKWRTPYEPRGPRLGAVTTSRVNGSVVQVIERAIRRPGESIWTTEQITECIRLGIGGECEFCHGSGWIAAKRSKPRCECWGLGRAARAQCRDCLGTGTPQTTARPVCTPSEASGNEVDGDTLKRFAGISRRLARMLPSHREVLRIHYGPEGQTWADHPMGRLLGLEVHTPAASELLARTHIDGEEATEASPAERIAVQDESERRHPHRWRRLLLDAAAGQAAAMLRSAHVAWLGRQTAGGWRESLAELEDEIDVTGVAWELWLDAHWVAGQDAEEDTRCG